MYVLDTQFYSTDLHVHPQPAPHSVVDCNSFVGRLEFWESSNFVLCQDFFGSLGILTFLFEFEDWPVNFCKKGIFLIGITSNLQINSESSAILTMSKFPIHEHRIFSFIYLLSALFCSFQYTSLTFFIKYVPNCLNFLMLL